MKHFALLALFGFLSISCQNDDSPVVYEEGTNQYTNRWIYEQMQKYYYWNGQMQKNVDISLSPKEYFDQLLASQDRFSYSLHPSIPETFPKSIRSNFGFDISFVEYQGEVLGVVLYVLNDSPAKNNGLKRGQYITTINGKSLSLTNFKEVYQQIISSDFVTLEVKSFDENSGFTAPKETTLQRGLALSQSVSYKIIETDNDKVGYVLIPHFDVGLAGTLLQIFQQLKANSVNELVLDLRYNGGGDVSSAAALSILAAPNIKADDLFIQFEGNRNGGVVKQSFETALEMNELQVNFATLRSAHPSIQKVYILCGNHTASASEIIINNLKPFMEVITIGDKTVGKDVAGFAVEDKRISGQQGWILYPEIYKLFNAAHEGNYSGGILPDVAAEELQHMEILPLGDTDEILLQRALEIISGHARAGHKKIQLLHSLKINYASEPLLIKSLY